MGLFAKFKEAWLKPMSFDSLNEGFYDDLEEALILADVGMDTAVDAVAQLKKRAYAKLLTHEEDVKNAGHSGGKAVGGRSRTGPLYPAQRGPHHRSQRRG